MAFPIALRLPRSAVIETLFSLMRRTRKKHADSSKLYVLEVGFELKPESEAAKSLEEQREYLLQKYGIDLLVVEPGFKLKRWDDI